MSEDEKIELHENQPIWTALNKEGEERYFPIVDTVRVLTDTIDLLAYWRKLKRRSINEVMKP